MKHTIISWDSTFRNFFHLIDGLLNQEYKQEEFELIYIEQRTRENADTYNHRISLKSLWDRYEEVKNRINIKVLYLNDSPEAPYHLGKCINAGLAEAKGELITVMDGDQLLPGDFLLALTDFHKKEIRIGNLYRVGCKHPSKYDLTDDWTKAPIDFSVYKKVIFGNAEVSIPTQVDNKGPMISARREYWEMVGGYDTHILWSTSASTVGHDFNTRLEIASSVESQTIPSFAIHPYHPVGYAKQRRGRDQIVDAYMLLQKKLTVYSRKNNIPNWHDRKSKADLLYKYNSELVDSVMEEELLDFKISHQEQIRNHVLAKYSLDFAEQKKQQVDLFSIEKNIKSNEKNIALYKPCKQSSLSQYSKVNDAQSAVNGMKNGTFSFHTSKERSPWWQVDLEEIFKITQIQIYNRLGVCANRLRTLIILISVDEINWEVIYDHDNSLIVIGGIDGRPLIVEPEDLLARYVRLQLNEVNILHLDEVEVFGYQL